MKCRYNQLTCDRFNPFESSWICTIFDFIKYKIICIWNWNRLPAILKPKFKRGSAQSSWCVYNISKKHRLLFTGRSGWLQVGDKGMQWWPSSFPFSPYLILSWLTYLRSVFFIPFYLQAGHHCMRITHIITAIITISTALFCVFLCILMHRWVCDSLSGIISLISYLIIYIFIRLISLRTEYLLNPVSPAWILHISVILSHCFKRISKIVRPFGVPSNYNIHTIYELAGRYNTPLTEEPRRRRLLNWSSQRPYNWDTNYYKYI